MVWMISVAFAGPPGVLPAGDTEVRIDVVGALADVRIRRTLTNPLDWPIDAELILAVPPHAAIDRMRVEVAGRVLRGRIASRNEAAAIYATAAEDGHLTGLLEDAGPGAVRQRIANVPPGADLMVEVHLVQPVQRVGDRWVLDLPLTIAPRFSTEDDDTIYTSDPGGVDLSMWVHSPIPIAWIESPSHPMVGHLHGNDGWIALDDAPADRDLSVQWSLAGSGPAVAAWRAEDHGVVLIEPAMDGLPFTTPDQDVVILVDTSGSTAGPTASQVADAVALVLDALRPGDRFTVLTFDDIVRGIAVREVPNDEAIHSARAHLARTPLSGGTQLALGLRFALDLPVPPDRALTVVMLTDASVADEGDDIAHLLQDHRGRVHTVGIGAAPHRVLLGEIAQRGGGVSTFLVPGGDVETALAPVIAALPGPILTDLEVTWGDETLDDPVPDLYPGQAQLLRFRGGLGPRVEVSGRYAGRPFAAEGWSVEVDDPRLVRLAWGQGVVDQAAQRQRGGDSTAAQVGLAAALEYQLVSPWTSMIAVDGTERINPLGGAVAMAMAMPLAGSTASEMRSFESTTFSVSGVAFAGIATKTSAFELGVDEASPAGSLALGGLPWAGPVVGAAFGAAPVDHALAAALAPRVPAIGMTPSGSHAIVRTPRNTAEVELLAKGLFTANEPVPQMGSAAGYAAGPIVRDHAWLGASVAADQRSFDGAEARWSALASTLRLQPSDTQILQGTLIVDEGRASIGDREAAWGSQIGSAFWNLVHPAPVNVFVGGRGSRQRWGEAWADTRGGQLGVSGGTSNLWLDIGADVAQTRWSTPEVSFEGLTATSSMGIDLELPAEGVAPTLYGDLAIRMIQSEDRAETLPLGGLVFDYPGRSTRVRAEVHRAASGRALPPALSEILVPRRWDAAGILERRIGAFWSTVRICGTHDTLPFVASPLAIPATAGETLSRGIAQAEVSLRTTRNPWIRLGYSATLTPEDDLRVSDPRAPWVPGFLDPHRRHRISADVEGTATPFGQPTTLVGQLQWRSAISGDAPWLDPVWIASARLAQAIRIRSVALSVELGVNTARNAPSLALFPLEGQLLLPDATRPAEAPWRWSFGLRGSL